MATMSTYTQFGYPYTPASQLLVSGSPSSNGGIASSSASSTSSSSASAAASGAASPGGDTSATSSGTPSNTVENTIHSGGSSSGLTTVSPSGGSSAPALPPGSSPCCDSGRPLMTDPVTGQTVCSCQYDRLQAIQNAGLAGYGPAAAAAAAARLAVATSAAVTGVTGLHYSAAYPSSDQNPYPSLGMDSTFYSSLTNPYSIKDGTGGAGEAWSTTPGLHQSATGYYPYDPTLAAYGYGASYDLAARRKNATRESTATLKAWLSEHKKNPYPTKGEKIMLAIITKMTLTQVSTWFANARRRLKKENKMTWEPKNRNDDDDDDDCLSDDEVSSPKSSQHHPMNKKMKHSKLEKDDVLEEEKSECEEDSRGSLSPQSIGSNTMMNPAAHHLMQAHHPHHLMHHHHHVATSNVHHPHHPHQHQQSAGGDLSVSVSVSNLMGNTPYHHHQMAYPAGSMTSELSSSATGMMSINKPKIWSLADTAACKTPPPPPLGAHQQHHGHQAHHQMSGGPSSGHNSMVAMMHPAAAAAAAAAAAHHHHLAAGVPPNPHSWFPNAPMSSMASMTGELYSYSMSSR